MKSFREVTVNPDIIIKFRKDVFLLDQETISLTAFDAENNNIIYSEERKLVDEKNDVDRLVDHFLAKVKIERAARTAELTAELEKEKSLAKTERDSDALKDAKVILSIYSSSESLLQAIIADNRTKPNEFHVFLREVSTEEDADVVLTEKLRQGNHVLILTSRDTKEILHTEVVAGNSLRRAVALMSKWITSTSWE
jgi:predicted RNA-binding Zn ribbon-like protein